ncbi:MAG: hypothetical protein EXR66_00530 [Dehalococcoidia bacterium]|nr:hypothetical protein [Dehalococcoidia bacterium]
MRATRLPRLERERYHYQGWLVNSETNNAISVGRFSADDAGVAVLDGTLPLLSDFGFDLFIVTVEPEPDAAPPPSDRRSIGGRLALGGQPNVRQPGDVANKPGQLPSTGAPDFLPDAVRGIALLGALGISAVLGARLGRRRA